MTPFEEQTLYPTPESRRISRKEFDIDKALSEAKQTPEHSADCECRNCVPVEVEMDDDS